jgi:glycosyltransferase involved in cell wall biosynthesis
MPFKNAVLEDGEEINYTVLSNDGSPYCSNILPLWMQKYKPEVFTILLDTFMLMQAQMIKWQVPAKSCFWYPSDGGYFPKFCEQILKKIDYPVAMAKWGQQQAKNLFDINAYHIPHGVRTDWFYPYSEEKKQQNRVKYSMGQLFAFQNNTYYPVAGDLTNKFILGCVSRNQGRKNLPEMIKAFCKFAENKPDVVLIMHSDPVDVAAVCDLQEIADRYGQGHKVLWTAMRVTNPYPTSRMNELYNLFDAFFLLTSGEGFGVPFIEAMSCEVPVIATDFTTTKEIVTDHDAGLAVKLMGEDERPYPYEGKMMNGTITGSWAVDRGFADFYNAVEKLNWAYNNREKLKVMGKNARKGVFKDYDWNTVVGPAWLKLIEDITK